MLRHLGGWLLLLASLVCSPVLTADITVVDSSGAKVTVPRLPERVVSLSPHGTELFASAGGADRLVAVTNNSDYPEAVKILPRVGPYNAVALESILSQRPDLIIAWPSGNPPEVLAQLHRLGIPVYKTEPHSIDNIAADLRAMGVLSGSTQGELQAEQLLNGWHALAEKYEQKKLVPVFVQVWSNPLLTLNGEHMVSSLLTICGARNIFADAPVLVPRISREDVIARQPAMIIEGEHGDRVGTDSLYREWQSYTTVPAVKNKDVYTFDGSFLLRPTPRLLKGAQDFCKKTDHARKLMR